MPARPVLILTDELAVNTVSEHRAELSAFYRLRLPSPAMVTALGDKELFQHFAESHALPVPHTILVKGEATSRGLRNWDRRSSSNLPTNFRFTWAGSKG